MKMRTIACSCLLVAASVGGAKTLAAASPDCARWIKEYQQGLARRAVLGKKHVVKAAHHLVVPRPHLQRVSAPSGRVRPPKLSPAEMLKRFKVLCGEDLPDEVMPAAFIPTGLEDAMIPPIDAPTDFDTLAGLPQGGAPSPFTPGSPTNGGGNPTGNQPVVPTNGGGTTIGGLPTTPIIPSTPITPSPVPEPDSLILLLTGLGTVPFILRMRRRSFKTS